MLVTVTVTLWSCASEAPTSTNFEPDVVEKGVISGPDLILITVESWRSDHLQSFGYSRNTMPALEQRLDSAKVYSKGIAPSSWTLPSMASIMTGLHPNAHGLVRPDLMLTEKVQTTAEALSAYGYDTAFFGVNAWFLGHAFGLSQGFQQWDARAGDSGDRLLKDIDGWLAQRTSDAPLFLHVHFFEPHCQYTPPRQVLGHFNGDGKGDVPRLLTLEQYESMGDCYRLQDDQGMPVLALNHYLQRYDEELLATDRLIEQAVEITESHLGLDEALVIMAGDHGETFWEHEDFGHGRQLYDESVVVPLILLGGLAGAPEMENTPVSLTQIHSTLLAASGLDSSTPGDLRQPSMDGPVFSETNQDGVSLLAVWLDHRKAIWNQASNEVSSFDLVSDPMEQRPQNADLLLQKVLEVYAAEQRLPGLVQPASSSSEQSNSLRQLGYLE